MSFNVAVCTSVHVWCACTVDQSPIKSERFHRIWIRIACALVPSVCTVAFVCLCAYVTTYTRECVKNIILTHIRQLAMLCDANAFCVCSGNFSLTVTGKHSHWIEFFLSACSIRFGHFLACSGTLALATLMQK